MASFRFRHFWPTFGLITFGLTLPAAAKDHGLKSPSGRQIYQPHDRFGEALNQRSRILVAETAIGSGPEGNLALLLGWLNVPIRRLDLYAGIGVEANPAIRFTLSGRYTLSVNGFRPYLALGYLFKNAYAIGSRSHSGYLELGHAWNITQTHRLSLGIGLRRILTTKLDANSPLRAPELDQDLTRQQLETIDPWQPMLALRFSRAF